MEISEIFHKVAASTEDVLDIARRRIWQRTGMNRPRHIAAYQGYESPQTAHISGRLLANKPGSGPMDMDGWWENLLNTYRRWESDEVPFTPVTLRYGEREITTETDEEGYYRVELPARSQKAQGEISWQTASVRSGDGESEVHAIHEILVTPTAAEYGVISDLDDTVIHTGISSILLAAKLTFLENSKTRKPLDGVAELYHSFRNGSLGRPVNPIFYISSSPWNLHDLLEDFINLNNIPAGPMILRDVGLDRNKLIKGRGHGHKLEKALEIIDGFSDLPFVLVGDSGQEDPAIYEAVVKERPGRVKAIYIRDIDPEVDSELDAKVRRSVRATESNGVPMILAKDSRLISEHAASMGLIRTETIPDIALETALDKMRPDLGEQAVKDAL